MNGAVAAPLCVYLLRNATGRTYIGFTNNPRRRLRQHNGEVKGGARKTRLGRPWEMLGFVHGFRYTARALFKLLERKNHGEEPQPCRCCWTILAAWMRALMLL